MRGMSTPLTFQPQSAASTGAISVLLVDGQVLFAQSLARLLADTDDITVLPTARTETAAEQLVAQLHPDIVLIALHLPDATGPEATRLVLSTDPNAKVLMLTERDNDAQMREAIRSGCAGYIAKTGDISEALDTIRRVARGESLIDEELRRKIAETSPLGSTLTCREREVLELLAQALSTRAIAAQLNISINTARNHIQRLLPKLGTHSKLEAVTTALREGVIQPRD